MAADPTPASDLGSLMGAHGEDGTPFLDLDTGGEAGEAMFDPLSMGALMAPPMPMLHDIKIRRRVSNGRLRIKALANEDFLIETAATSLDEEGCRFVAHLDTPTRSELLARGYDPDLVWDLKAVTDTTAMNARRQSNASTADYEDKAGERVEVHECYALLDPDESGWARWFQIVMGGPSGSRELLSFTEWGGKLPFSEVVPDPVPHTWKGRSLYDKLKDPQRVATALSRRINDNLYQTVEPGEAWNVEAVENPDAIYDRGLGRVVRVNGPLSEVYAPLTVPPIALQAQPIVEEQRRTAERRTGIGEQSSGLDADALTGQVATAIAAAQSASGLRKEDYARNIARGLRRMFSCLLRLMVENQDRERIIQLRKTWVPMDPRAWSAEMEVQINVGLGSGNRDRDLAMLQGIATKQEMIGAQLWPLYGLDNAILPVKAYLRTLRLMTEAAGVKSSDEFFPDPDPQVLAQMTAQAAQQKQQPDPKLIAAQQKSQVDLQVAQAKMQMEGQLAAAKAQVDAQLAAQKQQADQALSAAKAEAERQARAIDAAHAQEMDRQKAAAALEADRQRAQQALAVSQAKAEAELRINVIKAQADQRLKMQELALEAQLKKYAIDQGTAGSAPTNIPQAEE